MMLESQKWFQKVRRGYFFNLVWNSELRKQALEKGFKYSHEVEVFLKKGKKGKIDGLIQYADDTFKIIERKASDLSTITDKTIKSYIDDAAKYNNKAMTQTGDVIKSAGDKVILHVEKVGELSQDVLNHATNRGVEILDDISSLFN